MIDFLKGLNCYLLQVANGLRHIDEVVGNTFGVLIPTFTKPMTMTVTAPLDWIAAVPSVPIPTPTSLLLPVCEKSCLSRLEAADSRLLLIIVQATRNTPIPAVSVKRAVKILITFTIGSFTIMSYIWSFRHVPLYYNKNGTNSLEFIPYSLCQGTVIAQQSFSRGITTHLSQTHTARLLGYGT